MARRVVVTLVDDFDGVSAAEETVTFAIDGATYEIDLSETNAAKLREVFEQWTGSSTSNRTQPRTWSTPGRRDQRLGPQTAE